MVNNSENQVEDSLNKVYGKQSNLEVPVEMRMDFKDKDNQDKNEDNINPDKEEESLCKVNKNPRNLELPFEMRMDIEGDEVRMVVKRSVHSEVGEVTSSKSRCVQEAQDEQDNDVQCLDSSEDKALRRMFESKILGTASCTYERKTISQLI